MKKFRIVAILMLFVAGVIFSLHLIVEKPVWNSFKDPETAKMLKQFVAMKKAQAEAATNTLPTEIQVMFKYAGRGQWLALSNAFSKNVERNSKTRGQYGASSRWSAFADFVSDIKEKVDWHTPPRPALAGTPWETAREVWGAFDGFITGDEKYSLQFGREIIESIPAHSIYFSQTDPGRFIITAMCQSQPDGNPFFTIDKGALADDGYRSYLRRMYEGKTYIPTESDVETCFHNFLTEIQSAPDHSTTFKVEEGLTKITFGKNSERQFFVEGGIFTDWMYPYLEPHGLIFKLNRQPLEKLTGAVLQRDDDFWAAQIRPMIGDWLKPETTLLEISKFVKKTFGHADFVGFSGDANFIKSAYTQILFARSRSSIARLYYWRCQHAKDDIEKRRMMQAADLAFRQAWALCPHSPAIVFSYLIYLTEQNRFADAVLVAETAASLPQNQDNEQMTQLPRQLKQWQAEHPHQIAN